ncbi:MAG: HpcH/HpaI aldolase/citrate lyase family protein [Gemmatimonadetes bacterium]|nr:HpcH/HpaI aldolase/citrate lyase family protein [Gemmatimonadota bacterium]
MKRAVHHSIGGEGGGAGDDAVTSGMSTPSGTGEAGRRGEDVRSDCWASVEVSSEGGTHLELTSKVEAMFGASLRADIARTLESAGLAHARVRVEDQGAVPWVLGARLEAALVRAGIAPVGDLRPPRTAPDPPATARDRLRRSRLYLPGNEPKFMINAGLHAPDAVILDLEDSVHPGEKDAARLLVRNALRSVDFKGAERMVRINQLPLGLEDLDAVVPEAPDVILVPKVERADEVVAVHERIQERRRDAGVGTPVWIMPILESAQGIENAYAIAAAADTVVALTIGVEDYTADLGIVKTPEGTETVWARSRLVNAAKAAGVQAIDSVFGDVADEEGLLDWGRQSRAMGFEGMGCIHPRQIRIIHEAFAPSGTEIERALAIVAAFHDANAKGLGVVSLGTKMIDRPVVLRAQRLVARARAAGLIPPEVEAGEGDSGRSEA